MAEILATVDDINANLPSEDVEGSGAVAKATAENTALLQLSVARVVRGYLSAVIPSSVLLTWVDPLTTPEIVREAAAKMIAAHFFSNRTARTKIVIELRHWAQLKYDEAMAILNGIIAGTIVVVEAPVAPLNEMSVLDFFPVDDTDRAFSMGMEL